MLCRCANVIMPDCIRDMNEFPDKQFMKMQNINIFLRCLKTAFRIKEAELFSAEELFYASNFPRVRTPVQEGQTAVRQHVDAVRWHRSWPHDPHYPTPPPPKPAAAGTGHGSRPRPLPLFRAGWKIMPCPALATT